jgi:hypothetical protein
VAHGTTPGAEGCQARRPTAQHTAGPPLSNARTASNRAGAHHRRTQRRALTLLSTQKVRMHSQRITPTTGSTPTTQTTPATDAPLPSYRRTAAKPQPNPATRQRPLYNILSRTGRSLPSSFRSSVGQLVVAVVAVADVRVIRCSVVISACSEVARQPRKDRAGTSHHRHSLATIATRQDQTRPDER